jgi:hypothetical protein
VTTELVRLGLDIEQILEHRDSMRERKDLEIQTEKDLTKNRCIRRYWAEEGRFAPL